MHIFAKVLSVNEKEHQMTVRYWTDELSELDLEWPSESAIKVCKTDVIIDLSFEGDLSADEIRQMIDKGAPITRLEALTKVKKGIKSDSVERAKAMVGDVRDIWL